MRGTWLHRIYSRAVKQPTNWKTFRTHGPPRPRFDYHLVNEEIKAALQGRCILLAALELPIAVAEVFQNGRQDETLHGAPNAATETIIYSNVQFDHHGREMLSASSAMN